GKSPYIIGYGWGGLMDLSEVVYPNLVWMFYKNVELKGRGARTILMFYLKGKWYTLNRSMLASIFDNELGNQLAYFVSDSDLKDIADNMGDDMLNTIIETICVDRNTPGGIVRRNLKPYLYLFHVWILENILPKAGHLDAVTPFECYILYCFETEVYLDLPYIIMKEIIRIREAADDSKALGFGAMLTKIFEVFYVDLEGKEIIPTKGPINSISVTSNKISEKISARERDPGNPRVTNVVAPMAPANPAPTPVLVPAQFAQFQQTVTGSLQTLQRRYTELRTDSIHRTDHLARLEATQASQANSIRDFEIEQIRLRNVLGEFRSDITRSEKRIRTSIDELTQMFRRRFPSPPTDPWSSFFSYMLFLMLKREKYYEMYFLV
ncbi:hypothetical protein Dimus_027197, partial [Dionaea muscipula]